MVEWHHQLNGHEFEQTPGDPEGGGSLACCSPWGRKELDTNKQLNNARLWAKCFTFVILFNPPSNSMRWLLLQLPFIQMNQVLELRETEKLSQHHTASKWQSQIRNFSVRLQSLGCSCSQEALRDSLFSAYHVTPTFLGTAVLSRVQLFVTPWTVAHQASLSMRFPRKEYRSGLPFPSPGESS